MTQENTFQINKVTNLLLLAGILFLLLFGCRPLNVLHTTISKIDTSEVETINQEVVEMVQPYKIQLDDAMNIELAILDEDLKKEQPESTLGNHIAEITFWSAQKNYDKKIDFAISNYGGLRVPYINKGALKVKDAYQIMPFDNYVVIMTLPGKVVQQLADQMALNNGWPVYNLTFDIKEKKAVNITINGLPINLEQSYTFGITDYLANGGDNLSFLKEYNYFNTNLFLRDAIIEFWKFETSENRHILVKKDGRVKIINE